MKVTPSGRALGIDGALEALSTLSWRERSNLEIRKLAYKITDGEPDRPSKMCALIDELHRRFKYAADPLEERFGPVPLVEGSTVDVDDACLFVATLAQAIGIPCRFVAARFDRSWTCFVAYEVWSGIWETVDPLRQKVDREPDERVLGPLP